ncbi:MAG: polyprenyl synthetase family protein [Peptococcaceae bacterium]|nr:polyprenyl synthetase family protein [Peptococcaceae bacterium]
MFKQQYEAYRQLVENYLAQLPWDESLICNSMNYSLTAGGKRIRPVLALACIELVGGQPLDFIREVVALELIHTYSLIHDDLPAMDNDDFRRGKPSNHKMFGEATAILTGDALLTYAFELLAQPSSIPPEKQLRVIRETAKAAGWKGMIGGQVLDTLGSGQDYSLADIENIHRQKTGALLVASARLGAILGGGTEGQIEKISQYAALLGLAFQIKDDILDISSEQAILGKPVGSDLKQDKKTFVSMLGLAQAEKRLAETIAAAKRCLEDFQDGTQFLSSLADYIAQRNT